MSRLRGLLFLLLAVGLPLSFPVGRRPPARPAGGPPALANEPETATGVVGEEGSAHQKAPVEPPDPAVIETLIRQMGSTEFSERRAATRDLERIGEPALDALRKAARTDDDPEIQRRAEWVIERLQARKIDPRCADVVGSVLAILPPGWQITAASAETSPPDWHTDNPKAGLLVEGRSGTDTFRIWFLPRDWIGIRKVRNQAPRTCLCYWQGVLKGDRYKTITAAPDSFQQQIDRKLGMTTPSLVNAGGWEDALKLFRGRRQAADEAAVSLIRQYCHTPEEFTEAAHSLVVLGVPARNVYLWAAVVTPSAERDIYYSVLGEVGDREAIGLLCRVVADARLYDGERKYAVMALDRHADERIAPALRRALPSLESGEAIGDVARALAHRLDRAAAPGLLATFRRMRNDQYGKGEVAQALAALRCREAVPEFRRALAELPAQSPLLREDFEQALSRLTDDWGTPGKSVRVRLDIPARMAIGSPMPLRILVENTGTEELRWWEPPQDGLIIDGQPRVVPGQVRATCGCGWLFEPGWVHVTSYDLAPDITEPGEHDIQCVYGGACSNVITFTARPAGAK